MQLANGGGLGYSGAIRRAVDGSGHAKAHLPHQSQDAGEFLGDAGDAGHRGQAQDPDAQCSVADSDGPDSARRERGV